MGYEIAAVIETSVLGLRLLVFLLSLPRKGERPTAFEETAQTAQTAQLIRC